MAWTAKLKSVTTNGQNVVAVVTFDNASGETMDLPVPGNDLSDAILKNYCNNVIAQLNTRDASRAALTIQPGDTIPATPLPSTLADQFFADWRKLKALLLLVNAGILSNTATAVTNAVNAVKTEFDASYLNDPRFG